jgi:hypothetical protein
MDRTQASQLEKHILDAVDAIDRVRDIIAAASEEERVAVSVPLKAVASTLHIDLLGGLYDRYPELRPPPEEPEMQTLPRWEGIVLPESVTEAELDSIIFSALHLQWRKTAMVIGNALKKCRALAVPISNEVLGSRLVALAEAGRIEIQGDLRAWRHSEVRLLR